VDDKYSTWGLFDGEIGVEVPLLYEMSEERSDEAK
jgi:hypothetical protein